MTTAAPAKAISSTIPELPPAPPYADQVAHEHARDAAHTVTRTVVIALDSSAYSDYAFNWAVENFIKPESDLVVLVNVRPVASVPGPYGAAYMDFTDYLTQMEEQSRQASHRLLQEYGAKLKRSNIACKAIAMRGDPRDEITRKVAELNADVLIVGSRGLGAVKRTFLGSVSDYLIHHVHCAVLVVRDHEAHGKAGTAAAAPPTYQGANLQGQAPVVNAPTSTTASAARPAPASAPSAK